MQETDQMTPEIAECRARTNDQTFEALLEEINPTTGKLHTPVEAFQRATHGAPVANETKTRYWPEVTFQETGVNYVDSRRPFVSELTYRRLQHHLNPLNRFFGAKTLSDCANSDLIREYQVQRLRSAGPDCINKEISVIKGVLLLTRLWKRVEDDFKWLPVRESMIGRALSDDAYAALFAAAQTKPEWRVAYLAVLLAANSALSPSEIFSLRIREVDLENRTIQIRFDGKTHIQGKTRFRARNLSLNEYALSATKMLIERAAKLGAINPDHYLIPFRVRPGVYDPTRHANDCRSAWRTLVTSIGERGLRIKDLRHHAITVLDEHGVAKMTMRSLAGHSPNSKVIDHYSHPRVEARRKAVEILEANHRRVTEDPPATQPAPLTQAPVISGTWTFLTNGGNQNGHH